MGYEMGAGSETARLPSPFSVALRRVKVPCAGCLFSEGWFGGQADQGGCQDHGRDRNDLYDPVG